jgi:hypothetical protein
MVGSATYGLIGRSGNMGIAIAKQLLCSTDTPILKAGRDLSKA